MVSKILENYYQSIIKIPSEFFPRIPFNLPKSNGID